MKIEHLRIENFRGIRKLELSALSDLNVIAGINGSGKSSVLVAIKILLSWLIARIRHPKGRGLAIRDKDITIGADFCLLKIKTDTGISWQIYKQRSGRRSAPENKSELSELSALADSIANRLFKNEAYDTNIPLIAAYGVNRSVVETPMRVRKTHLLQPTDALTTEMSETVNFHDFFIWFREVEDIENENFRDKGHLVEDKRLKAVRNMLETIFPDYSDFKVQRSPRAFIIKKEGMKLDFNQLSDGEKAYLALMMDIARKLAVTHPAMENPLEGDGVVLIDEIELHLHPSWQREVTGNLRKAFPNCQFIVTTHSPHVVSCVNLNDNDKLITISDGMACEATTNQYGQESDMVLAEIFRMDSVRNPMVQEHIDKIWEHLDKKDFNSAEFAEEFDWLKTHVDRSDKLFAQINLQIALIKKGL